MKLTHAVCGATVLLLVIAAPVCLFGQPTTAPQSEEELEPMLKITRTRGPDLPQGFQDSDGGFIGDTLITACGFCSGEQNASKPDRYPRGSRGRRRAAYLPSG